MNWAAYQEISLKTFEIKANRFLIKVAVATNFKARIFE